MKKRKIEMKKARGHANNVVDADTKYFLLSLIEEIEIYLSDNEEQLTEEEIAEEEQIMENRVSKIINNSLKDNEVMKIAINKAISNANLQKQVFDKNNLPENVRKEIRDAYVNGIDQNKQQFTETLNKILVKNSIVGVEVSEIIEAGFQTQWEDNNPIYSMLAFMPFTKWKYTEQEMLEPGVVAHGWDSLNVKNGKERLTKLEQDLILKGKNLTTDYIYKRQAIERKDYITLMNRGDWAMMLSAISRELDAQIINSILLKMFSGIQISDPQDGNINFEPIPTADDIFTYKAFASNQQPTIEDIRAMCDEVKAKNGKEKILIISTKLLSNISRFYASGSGSPMFLSKEQVAAQLGVSQIFDIDLLIGIQALCFVPKGYYVLEEEHFEGTFFDQKHNVLDLLKERLAAGAIHDLKSASVLFPYFSPVTPSGATVTPEIAASGVQREITVQGGGQHVVVYADQYYTNKVAESNAITPTPLYVYPTTTTTYYVRVESGQSSSGSVQVTANVE